MKYRFWFPVLLTWYAIAAGTLEFAPIVVKKAPTKRGALPFANPYFVSVSTINNVS
jgi:hypothetical protein